MKRIYVVVGELEDTNEIDCFEGAYHSMERADERCAELETESQNHIYYWHEVVLEEEGDLK